MAAVQTHKASWLAWLVLGLAATAQAQFDTSTTSRTRTTATATPWWTVTYRLVESTSTSTYTYRTTTERYRQSVTRTVKSTVTPSATPTSTSTQYRGYSYDDDLQVIYAYYSEGSFSESDLEPDRYDYSATTTRTSSTSYVYIMPVTWTAPSSCSGSTSFSVTTTVTPTIPSRARDQVTPTSKVSTTSSAYYYSSTYNVETWYLTAGAAPSTSDYYYRSYVAQCSAPPFSGSRSGDGDSGSGSGRGSNGYNGIEWCSWYTCTSATVWIIIVATVIPGIFLLGFLESYFWFRRLMLGKGALRLGTMCWIFLSLWMVCFTRTASRRSAEDQKLLRENWKKTSFGQALKLWFKWGFRHRYPVPLLGQYSRNTVGIVPEGQPLPQMGQTNVTYPGFQPQVGGTGAPGIIYHNGQAYYAGQPPPGWVPGPNADGQPIPPPGTTNIPPPGTAYIPPQQYTEAFAPPARTKDVSTASVSPIQESTAPNAVSAPANIPTPPPATHSGPSAPAAELHDGSGALPPPQGPPPNTPPTAKPT